MPETTYRWPAEWEPQRGVQLTFPHAAGDWGPLLDRVTPTFVRLAEEISRRQPLLVVCDDEARVRPLLRDCPPQHLHLYELPSNDTWARDHGGLVVLEGTAARVLDFMFNGWGLKFAADRDNLLTGRLHAAGAFGGVPLLRPPLVLEGGSVDTDGRGTVLTTAECLLSPNRNPHLSKEEIERALRRWLGAERVLWLHHGALAGDDTDAHVDTLARFCDPTTICYVACDRPDDPHHAPLRRMEAELRTFRTPDGAPYR
ncbi:MAG: agmatine deiminase family protein, partial [Catalinimonas sp.]